MSIHQKDDQGDGLIHFAIFSNKYNFIVKVKHLYETEINLRNDDWNTPFHYACLTGNL